VRAVTELLRFESEKRKIAFAVDVAQGLPPLAADPDQLQQVLVNLVLNACDACDGRPGGTVTISAALEPSDDGQAWSLIRIAVIDDGCGIPQELRHQIFDPFFTTKKRGQGTGLGLTIAAQIVRNHGGRIDLESETGRGTRVTMLWPAAAAAEGARHAGG
jgi:signal transduction histidine kinase